MGCSGCEVFYYLLGCFVVLFCFVFVCIILIEFNGVISELSGQILAKRDVKLIEGRVKGRMESPQEGKCNSTSEGSILTVGSQ